MKNDASHEALKDLTALLKRCRFWFETFRRVFRISKVCRETTSERCPQPEQRNCSANWSCLLLARWSATRYVTSIFGCFKFSATPVSQSKASIFQWKQRCKGCKSSSTQQGVLVYLVSVTTPVKSCRLSSTPSRCLRLNVEVFQSIQIHRGPIRWHCGNDMQPASNEENDDFLHVFLVLIRRRRRRMVRCFKGFQGCRNLWPDNHANNAWDHFDFHETQQFHKKIQRFKSAFYTPGRDSETFLFFRLATKLREELEFLEEKHPLKSIFGSKILKKIRLFWRVSLSKLRRVRRGQRGLMVKRATKIVERVVFFPEKTSQVLFFKNFEHLYCNKKVALRLSFFSTCEKIERRTNPPLEEKPRIKSKEFLSNFRGNFQGMEISNGEFHCCSRAAVASIWEKSLACEGKWRNPRH